MICNNKFPETVKKLGNQGLFMPRYPLNNFYFSTLSLFPKGWLLKIPLSISTLGYADSQLVKEILS